MLKRSVPGSAQPRFGRWLRAGSAAVAAATAAVTLAAGCLDRPVQPQKPTTSNVYVAEIRQTAVDKIDLLFMIDNSLSMADKQTILAEAVPVLVQRLITPVCINEDNGNTAQRMNNGQCPSGFEPEFNAIRDIHIGIVTSSLGDHGAEGPCAGPQYDDKGQMLASVRPMLAANMAANWNGQGFLAWDPDAALGAGRARNNPPGVSDQGTFINAFEASVAAADENGCGYEASLEAWYRFLIDPLPPSTVTAPRQPNGVPGDIVLGPPNGALLAQRAAFLRPDSLVAIVMLTDENDCSVADRSQGWLTALTSISNQAFKLPKSTTACAANPNDKCCQSCLSDPVGGCTAPAQDAACTGTYHDNVTDHPNLRCYEQKRRFGFDLLYPISRYVDGLTQPTLVASDGVTYPNPLFAGPAPRDQSLIFLAGIIGVPWQDVATRESAAPNAPLQYLTYSQLLAENRWAWILGTDDGVNAPTRPLDGLMFETPADRSTLGFGPHPLNAMGGNIPPLQAAGPGAANHPINGKETLIADGSDLQYACTFPLPEGRRDCTAAANVASCDCTAGDAKYERGLCDPASPTTQIRAKAYPGVRELQLLRAYGDRTQNSIVASICPKVVDPARRNDPSYGYTPAVAAIIERLKEALRGKCLPRPLSANAAGQVPCAVVEAKRPATDGTACACDPRVGRVDLMGERAALRQPVLEQMSETKVCGEGTATPDCNTLCLCEIQQFEGDLLGACQTQDPPPQGQYGYCYVDPETLGLSPASRMAQEELVERCPSTQRRLLRFVGDNVPAKGSIAMIACLGSTIRDDDI